MDNKKDLQKVKLRAFKISWPNSIIRSQKSDFVRSDKGANTLSEGALFNIRISNER